MATAIRGKGAAYDVRPAREWDGGRGGLIRSLSGMARSLLGGLLVFFGGVHLTGNGDVIAPSGGGLGQLHELVHELSVEGVMGPIEIAVGLLLLVTVRETASRAFGLLLVIVVIVGYANGYTLADMLTISWSLLRDAVGGLENAAARGA